MQTIRVRTTQNVMIEYPVAGLFDRILATLLDTLIFIAYILLVVMVLALLDINQEWLFFVFYVPILFYHLIFEIAMNGQSPGKRAMNVRVVRLDGNSPTIGNYILRWILRPVDILLYGSVAITCILLTANGQRLGDIAAGTSVVKMSNPGPLTSQVVLQSTQADYQPQFPQVIHMTDKDIRLVKEALSVYTELGHTQPMHTVSDKIRSQLNIATDMSVLTFLNTVVKDYHYLTSAGG